MLLVSLPLWSGSGVVGFRDTEHFYLPAWTAQAAGPFGSTGCSQWDETLGLGVPAGADLLRAQWYPPRLICRLPVAPWYSLNLYLVFHLVLAGLGTFQLARQWHAAPWGAALGGISYALSGPVVFQVCNVPYLASAAWLPWFTLAAWRLLHHRRWTTLPAASLSLGMMTLAGDPQTALHAAAVTGWLACAWPKERRIGRFVLWVVAVAGAVLLTAIAWVPAATLAARSVRAADPWSWSLPEWIARGAPWTGPRHGLPSLAERLTQAPPADMPASHVYAFSMGPWRLAEWIWPAPFGRLYPTHRRWLSSWSGEERVWTPALYAGLIPGACAACMMLRRLHSARLRWLRCVFLLALLASLGGYGLGTLADAIATVLAGQPTRWLGPVGSFYWLLVCLVPGYGQFRYPAKWLVFCSMAMALAAALAAGRWNSAPLRRWLVALSGFSTLAWLGTAIATPFLAPRLAALPPDPVFGPVDIAGAMADLRYSLLHAALVAAVGVVLLRRRTFRHPDTRTVAMVLVAAVELLVANRWLVPILPPSAPRYPVEEQFPENHRRPVRIVRPPGSRWIPAQWRKRGDRERLPALRQWNEMTLLGRHGLAAGCAVLGTHEPLENVHTSALLAALWREPQPEDASPAIRSDQLLDVLGVDGLLSDPGMSPPQGWARKGQWHHPDGASVGLFVPRQKPVPCYVATSLYWLNELHAPATIHQVRRRTQQACLLLSGDRRYAPEAVIEAPASDPWLPVVLRAGRRERAVVEVEEEKPDRVRVRVTGAHGGLLVVSRLYLPGWHAHWRPSGKEAWRPLPVWRTNRVFCGVPLPASEVEVELRYEVPGLDAARLVSGGTVLVLLTLAAWGIWQRRRSAAAKAVPQA